MAAVSHNHANYQARLDFVQNLLQKRFNLKGIGEITPIQYDPQSPFKYNNFVYRVSLPVPITTNQASKFEPQQPGCVPIPNGTKELIFRPTNPNAEGMNQITRVENEVATIALASGALAGFVPHVVPSVYAWGSAAIKSSQGWIIQELMPGVPHYRFRGGVTFDDAGHIVSTAMTSVGAGPWPSYEAIFKGRLEVALQKADANPYINGWHANGVRERLDGFVERGIPAQFETLCSKDDRVIVHADFTANNVLFDPTSGRVTALIDYDFACVSHPSYEFLRSFDDTGGQFRGWSNNEASEDMALREAKLHGFPSPLPATTKGGVKWDVVNAWEDELEKLNVKRPRNIPGIDRVADVDTILRTILLWRVSNSEILRLQSDEVIIKCSDENEQQLVGLLSRLGF